MVLVRLAYVADLPVPAELVRALDGRGQRASQPRSHAPSPASGERAGARGQSAAGGTRPHPPTPLARAPPSPAMRERGLHRRRSAASSHAAIAAAPLKRRRTPRAGARIRSRAAEFCRGDRAVRQTARGADALASVVACASRRVRAGAHRIPAERDARRAISPTGSGSCSANGPGSAGSSRSRRRKARRRLAEQAAQRDGEVAERGCGPPVGSGGAGHLSRRDDRCGARAGWGD